MSKPVCGVGIVGYGPGSASQTFHMPLITHEQQFEVRVVSTTLPDVVCPLLPEMDVVTEVSDVVHHPAIDLVVIATPNAWHYEYAKQALEAGKHVVVEKPLTLTTAEADELIALAKQKGVLLTQFHNRRWDGGFLTVQKLLREGSCGKPTFFEMHYDRYEPKLSGNWRETKAPGNGVLFDLGVHLLDQTFALFGRPKSVYATILSQRDPDSADDFFQLDLEYEDLQIVLGANLLAATPGPRYRLCGTKGTFVKAGAAQQDPQAGMLISGLRPGDKRWGEDTPEQYGTFSDGDQTEVVPTVPGAYQSFYHALAKAVTGDGDLPVSVEDARDIIAVIEAANLSRATGRKILADEIGFLLP
jgi:scyllo-inositol 2-dehydrogenase (NADP+)